MSDSRDTEHGAEVLDLGKSRDRAQRARQDRAASELAARFHQAMGWKGRPDAPGGTPGKKGKRKKKR